MLCVVKNLRRQRLSLKKIQVTLQTRSFVGGDLLITVTSAAIPVVAGCGGLVVGACLGNIDVRQDDWWLSSMAREAVMMACLFVLLSLYLKAWFDEKFRATGNVDKHHDSKE